MHSTRTRSFSGEIVDLALDDLAEPEGAGDERAVVLLDDGAHPVGAVEGLAGGRPHLAEHDEAGCRRSRGGSPTTPNSSRSAKQRSASRPQPPPAAAGGRPTACRGG